MHGHTRPSCPFKLSSGATLNPDELPGHANGGNSPLTAEKRGLLNKHVGMSHMLIKKGNAHEETCKREQLECEVRPLGWGGYRDAVSPRAHFDGGLGHPAPAVALTSCCLW